jgi:hypothetical protein
MRAMFSVLFVLTLAVALQRGAAGLWHDALPLVGLSWVLMVCALASPSSSAEGRP